MTCRDVRLRRRPSLAGGGLSATSPPERAGSEAASAPGREPALEVAAPGHVEGDLSRALFSAILVLAPLLGGRLGNDVPLTTRCGQCGLSMRLDGGHGPSRRLHGGLSGGSR